MTSGKRDEGSLEATRYLVLRWKELFDRYTPDTYRPRLMDTPGLLAELRWVGELDDSSGHWGRHRRMIVEELQDRLPSDELVRECCPRQHVVLSNCPPDASPTTLVSIAKLGLEALDSYEELAFKALERLVDSEDGALPKKEKAEHLLSIIATRAVQRGFGRHYCEDILGDDALTWTPGEVVDALRKGLRVHDREWMCVYALSDGKDGALIRSLLEKTDFTLMQKSEKPSGGNNWTSFERETKGARHALRRVAAQDARDAVHRGLAELSHIVNVANYYLSAAPIQLERVLFAMHEREQYLEVMDATSISGLQPHKEPVKRATQVVGALARENASPELAQSLEQRATAYQAADARVRLVNLWSAMETLVSVWPEASVHQRVTSTIPAILTAARPAKVLKYVAIMLHQQECYVELIRCQHAFDYSTPHLIEPLDVLRLLTHVSNPEAKPSRYHNDDLKNIVFPALSEHPVLRNRLFLLWKEFRSPGEVRKRLQQSHRAVEWQLERIYRARNLIVHKGHSPDALPYLLKNLEYYYSTVLGRVLADLQDHATWTLMDALQSRVADYKFLNEALSKDSDIVTPTHLHIYGPDPAHEVLRRPIWRL